MYTLEFNISYPKTGLALAVVCWNVIQWTCDILQVISNCSEKTDTCSLSKNASPVPGVVSIWENGHVSWCKNEIIGYVPRFFLNIF